MKSSGFSLALLHPRYWLTWLGVGFLAVIAQLPYSLLMLIGKGLGHVLYRVNAKRRAIAIRNLEICFPKKSACERHKILVESFESLGIAVFETAMAWFWPAWRLRRIYSVEGLEHVRAALDKNPNLLMLGLHLTTIDIGGVFMGMEFRMGGMYRINKNAAYDWVQRWGRQSCRPDATFIPSDNVRALVKHLRLGEIFWYAPDQDHGLKGSEFVSFFGVQRAMLAATSTLAKLGKAGVVPVYTQRLSGGRGYKLTYLPALENFPSGDSLKDTQQVSDYIEAVIKLQPSQYLWVQKHFKTRPEGQPALYPARH